MPNYLVQGTYKYCGQTLMQVGCLSIHDVPKCAVGTQILGTLIDTNYAESMYPLFSVEGGFRRDCGKPAMSFNKTNERDNGIAKIHYDFIKSDGKECIDGEYKGEWLVCGDVHKWDGGEMKTHHDPRGEATLTVTDTPKIYVDVPRNCRIKGIDF